MCRRPATIVVASVVPVSRCSECRLGECFSTNMFAFAESQLCLGEREDRRRYLSRSRAIDPGLDSRELSLIEELIEGVRDEGLKVRLIPVPLY